MKRDLQEDRAYFQHIVDLSPGLNMATVALEAIERAIAAESQRDGLVQAICEFTPLANSSAQDLLNWIESVCPWTEDVFDVPS